MRINVLTIYRLSFYMLTLSFISACGAESNADNQLVNNLARPAKLLVVGQTPEKGHLNYPAIIRSQQLSTLSFEVSGVLQKIYVKEAQEVKQGEPLAALDQRDLQTKLDSARAQHDNANAEYQRAVRLHQGDAISRSELEQRKSKQKVNRAQFEETQKALQDSILVAPHDGHIASIAIREKEAVQKGEAAIDILGQGGLEAVINLPSRIMATSKTRKNSIEQPYLVLDVAPEQKVSVMFKEASLEADTATQTFAVSFTFDAPDDLNILPGMNATVWFRDPSKSLTTADQIWIPLTAIATEGSQQYVWVVNNKTMSTHRRSVEIEPGVGVELAISNGLEAGETIVVSGISTLSEGMIVRSWAE